MLIIRRLNCIIKHLVSSNFVGGVPLRKSSLNLRTGRPPTKCDDTRSFIIQFLPPDDEHIVLETCRGYSKLIIKQEFVH